jgi:hypothetical protein
MQNLANKTYEKEFLKYLTDTSTEAIKQKDKIIEELLKKDQERAWDLIEKEYKALLLEDNSLSRLKDLEEKAHSHNREFTRHDRSVWLVEYDETPE